MKKDRTPEEVLRAAVEVAVKAGWEKPKLTGKIGKDECPIDLHSGTLFSESILFDHSFAKAFFPKGNYIDEVEEYGNQELGTPFWECGLLAMVLKKDRLEYISRFL